VPTRHRVVLLPGSELPAAPAYAGLLQALGERADAVAKDLEVYAHDAPPEDYSLELEAEGILREADARGFDRFHLVGYSGGGAASLVCAAMHGERLLSLAVLEPAWAATSSTSPRYGHSTGLAAIFPDSRWRRSPSATTSTRRTGSRRRVLPARCSHSGSAPKPEWAEPNVAQTVSQLSLSASKRPVRGFKTDSRCRAVSCG
jgi:pimeloyl-ACP methyl ester carboxylesterase